jgi:hypothetical protein
VWLLTKLKCVSLFHSFQLLNKRFDFLILFEFASVPSLVFLHIHTLICEYEKILVFLLFEVLVGLLDEGNDIVEDLHFTFFVGFLDFLIFFLCLFE